MKRSAIMAAVISVIILAAGIWAIAKVSSTPAPSPSPTNSPATTATATPSTSPGTSPAAAASPTPASGTTVDVTTAGFGTNPIKVTSGQPLTFVNKSTSLIQVDSNPHPQHTDNPELNVGQIAPGESKTITPIRKGSFGIHNHLETSQTDTVIVE